MPTVEEIAAVVEQHQPWGRSKLECTCGLDFDDWESWALHVAQEVHKLEG